jgi:hypothetical protein
MIGSELRKAYKTLFFNFIRRYSQTQLLGLTFLGQYHEYDLYMCASWDGRWQGLARSKEAKWSFNIKDIRDCGFTYDEDVFREIKLRADFLYSIRIGKLFSYDTYEIWKYE